MTDDLFLIDRLQHTLHRKLNILNYLINDIVETHIDIFSLGNILRGRVRLDIETDDNGIRCNGKVNIGFIDGTDSGMNHLHLYFIILNLLQRIPYRFYRTLHIRLQNNRQILQFSGFNLIEEGIQANLLSGLLHHLLLSFRNEGICIGLRLFFIIFHLENLTGIRHGIQAENLYRHRRCRFLDSFSLIINHGTNLTEGRADSHNIADMQCTLLHKKASHRTSSLIQFRLDNHSIGFSIRVGFQLQDIRFERDVLQKFFQSFSGLRRYRTADGASAVILRNEIVGHEFLLYLVDICRRLINLINGNNHFRVGRLRMINGLNGLRFNAVIRSYNQYGNIRRLGTAHTHRREGLMSRRIEEGNRSRLSVYFDGNLISTDRLGDSAMLFTGYIGISDRIQDGRLTVVNVSHYSHNRRTCLEILLFIHFRILYKLGNDIHFLFLLTKNIVLHGNILRIFIRKLRVQGYDLPFQEELLNDIRRLLLHLLRKLFNRNHFRKRNGLNGLFHLFYDFRLNEGAFSRLLYLDLLISVIGLRSPVLVLLSLCTVLFGKTGLLIFETLIAVYLLLGFHTVMLHPALLLHNNIRSKALSSRLLRKRCLSAPPLKLLVSVFRKARSSVSFRKGSGPSLSVRCSAFSLHRTRGDTGDAVRTGRSGRCLRLHLLFLHGLCRLRRFFRLSPGSFFRLSFFLKTLLLFQFAFFFRLFLLNGIQCL